MFFNSWDVFLAAIILALPPICFSIIKSIQKEPLYRFALLTCIIDWIVYSILVPNYLFEYPPLEDAFDTMQNLSFFVTLILLSIIVIPTLMDCRRGMNSGLTLNQIKILIALSIIFPTVVIFPVGETAYAIKFESISWLIFRQSIRTELPIYYYLSDFILSLQAAPTFPIGVLEWILSFFFIYQISQYSIGYSNLRNLKLLGFATLIPRLFANIFLVAMKYQPSSIIHLPIPALFLAGLIIVRKLQPPLTSEILIEEVDVPVPLLHRLKSKFWGKEK
jgi:hypothetical protein